jgi:hypothetical protein
LNRLPQIVQSGIQRIRNSQNSSNFHSTAIGSTGAGSNGTEHSTDGIDGKGATSHKHWPSP